jgi:hypothetical protein
MELQSKFFDKNGEPETDSKRGDGLNFTGYQKNVVFRNRECYNILGLQVFLNICI